MLVRVVNDQGKDSTKHHYSKNCYYSKCAVDEQSCDGDLVSSYMLVRWKAILEPLYQILVGKSGQGPEYMGLNFKYN